MPPLNSTAVSGRRFQRDLLRLLLVFGFVAIVDLLVISLFSGRLRLWFPQWIDPSWATNPDSPVVYSQSYVAGILLLPVLLHAIQREFLSSQSGSFRAAFWLLGVSIFGFILWWKGGLMVEHHKHWEALAFGLLAFLLYGLALAAETLPHWVQQLDSQTLLRRLLIALSGFFLLMAVLDPVVQVGVQKLPWSPGLIIEMIFFVPAGLLTLLISHRLRPRGNPEGEPEAKTAQEHSTSEGHEGARC